MDEGKIKTDELAKISLISHKHQLWKAHRQVKRLRVCLIVSNCLWLLGAIFSLLMR